MEDKQHCSIIFALNFTQKLVSQVAKSLKILKTGIANFLKFELRLNFETILFKEN